VFKFNSIHHTNFAKFDAPFFIPKIINSGVDLKALVALWSSATSLDILPRVIY
jgi:hypothetical protein